MSYKESVVTSADTPLEPFSIRIGCIRDVRPDALPMAQLKPSFAQTQFWSPIPVPMQEGPWGSFVAKECPQNLTVDGGPRRDEDHQAFVISKRFGWMIFCLEELMAWPSRDIASDLY